MAPGRKMLGGKNKPPYPPSVLPDPAATPCLPPRSKTMVLGGNSTHSRHPSVLPDEAAAMKMPGTSQLILLRVSRLGLGGPGLGGGRWEMSLCVG